MKIVVTILDDMGFLFFIFGLAFLWFLVLIVLFVFVPCFIIALINLIKGAKNGWPKRNVIPLIITGSICVLIILLGVYLWATGRASASDTSSSVRVYSAEFDRIVNLLN